MSHAGWDFSIYESNKILNPGESVYLPIPSLENKLFKLSREGFAVFGSRWGFDVVSFCLEREGPKQKSLPPVTLEFRRIPESIPEGTCSPLSTGAERLWSSWKWLRERGLWARQLCFSKEHVLAGYLASGQPTSPFIPALLSCGAQNDALISSCDLHRGTGDPEYRAMAEPLWLALC